MEKSYFATAGNVQPQEIIAHLTRPQRTMNAESRLRNINISLLKNDFLRRRMLSLAVVMICLQGAFPGNMVNSTYYTNVKTQCVKIGEIFAERANNLSCIQVKTKAFKIRNYFSKKRDAFLLHPRVMSYEVATITENSDKSCSKENLTGEDENKVISTNIQRKIGTNFVARAAEAVSPAVCRIDTERFILGVPSSLDHAGQNRLDDESLLVPERIEQGQGSGVIYSSDGLVLTNAHVVQGANKVYITLTDGRRLLASLKGADELTDIAVLKIETDNKSISFPVAELGDSDNLAVGDWVIAVGNPVGLDSTVTLGIVSNLKRSSAEVGIPNRKVTFIQTDAAINPGNSGGALVNEIGEVVGINTAIRAYAEGIGFAIPINKAKQIMHDLSEGKLIQHPYIGIRMTTITPDMARQNNADPNAVTVIPEVNGAMVLLVLPNTPAADSQLRRYDVITEMKNHQVNSANDFAALVDECTVGEDVYLVIIRAGQRMGFVVRPQNMLNVSQQGVQQHSIERWSHKSD